MTDERTMVAKEAVRRRCQQEGIFPSPEEAIGRIATERGLRFYLGIDPTGPSVHIGHTIPILLLADLVRLGHTAILLIGDFTARIGDPTDKEAARTELSEDQVRENMASYVEQIRRIVPDTEFEIRYNSEWLASLTMEHVLRLTGKVTVQQMLARDMFQERLKKEKPIHVSEFLYPLLQGYDSVALRVDGEIGGNDQIFNMLVGRDLVREMLGKEKLVLATRLLVDAASGKKISKTEGGFIAVDDPPQEIRRKVLATVPDEMISTVFELCTTKPLEWVQAHAADDARERKEALVEELVRMYHGSEAVQKVREPVMIPAGELAKGLVAVGIVPTMSAAKDLIDQGAVEVNGDVVSEWKHPVVPGDTGRAGKGKFFKVS